MNEVVGYVIYGAILGAIAQAAGKAAWQMRKNEHRDTIQLKYDKRKRVWC